MPKKPSNLRRNLSLLAVLAVVAAGVGLTLTMRHQAHQRRIAACRQQRSEIVNFRKDGFDAQLARMRQMRLNPEQVATLRRVDPVAFARYVQAYGDQVDQVAQAADRLGAMVDAYRAGDCLEVK